jgi:hypothetical protein
MNTCSVPVDVEPCGNPLLTTPDFPMRTFSARFSRPGHVSPPQTLRCLMVENAECSLIELQECALSLPICRW